MLILCQSIFVQTSHACVVYIMLCICKNVLCYGPVASISLINYYYYLDGCVETCFDVSHRRGLSVPTFTYGVYKVRY